MSRTRFRVLELAAEAELDLDEALVTLWDAGFDVNEPSDFIERNRVAAARTALGITDPKALMQVQHWLRKSKLPENEFRAKLASVGVDLSQNARRLPKNSLRRVRQLFGDDLAPNDKKLSKEPDTQRSENSTLVWVTIGSTPVGQYLTAEEVRMIHEALTTDFESSGDPIFPPGVKNSNLLDSAVHRPQTSLGGDLKYASAEMASAALFHSLVLNHPFHNGNKRVGLVATLAFLDRCGLVLTCTQEELFQLTLRIAKHGLIDVSVPDLADREVIAIAQWINGHSRDVRVGETPMRWLVLRRVLTQYGCELTKGRGNQMTIVRTIPERTRLLGLSRPREVSTKVSCSGMGSEADKTTVHKIRKDLELDDAHGVDSDSFHSGETIDEFIVHYRHILRKLGRL